MSKASSTKTLCSKFQLVYRVLGASQVALVVKNLPANVGDSRDMGSIPGLGRSHGEGTSNPLQYSCLGNSMDSGTWRATVCGVAESWTQLSMYTLRSK